MDEKKILDKKEEDIITIDDKNVSSYADLIFLDVSCGACYIEDIMSTYCIEKNGLNKIIGELRKRGHNIQIKNPTKKEKEMFNVGPELLNKGDEVLPDIFEHKEFNDNDTIKMLVLSDLRFGSKFAQHSILNDICKKYNDLCDSQNIKEKYILINGDALEGMFKGAKEYFNNSLHIRGPLEQVDYFCKMLPRIDGVKYLLITGEHDLSFLLSKMKVDVGKLIESKREDVTYLGQKRSKIVFCNNRNENEIVIDARHQAGNIPYTISYRSSKILESLRNEDKTDVLLLSHFLSCEYFLKRDVRLYQIPSVVATTPEMTMRSIPLYNTVGGWILTLNKDKTGKLESTSQIFIPYHTTVKNDYLNAKQLVITDTKSYNVSRKPRRRKDDIDKLFTNINNNDSLTVTCEKNNISEVDLRGLLVEMEARGYNVKIQKNKDNFEEYIEKVAASKKEKLVKSNFNELEHVKLVLISDTHCCSKWEQKSFVEEIYKEGYENGYRHFLHFGDIDDGLKKKRESHMFSLHTVGFTAQLKYAANNYFPVIEDYDKKYKTDDKGKPIYDPDEIHTWFVTGNHPDYHWENAGAEYGEHFEDKRKDFHWLGKSTGFYKFGPKNKTVFQVSHTTANHSNYPSYSLQQEIMKMEPGCKPNLLGQGHYHQSSFLNYRNVLAFKVPCLVADSDFAKSKVLENTMGAYFVDLYIDKKTGYVEIVEFNEKRFSDKDVKDNNYGGNRMILKKPSN